MLQKQFLPLFLVLILTIPSTAQLTNDVSVTRDTVNQGDEKVKTLNELFRANLNADPVKALSYAREALNLSTEIDDKKGMAASYNNLGIIYRNQGALDKAVQYYLTALKIYETLANKEGIASTKNNIANVYAIKKDYALALRYLEESYTLFVELNDQEKIIGSMNNLGNLNIEIQLFEKATKYFSQANQLSEQIGIKFADPLTNLGNILFKQGNYQRAIEFYEKALVIERENNNQFGILNIITNLGITYAKAKQPTPAERYLSEATALCNEIEAYSFLPSIYKASAELLALKNQFKEAYQMQLQYDEARERMYGEESSRNIAQMEMIIDFQEKEKEYDLLKQQGEITKLELRNSRLFIVMIILAILIVLGALNFYYLNSKKIIKRKSKSAV